MVAQLQANAAYGEFSQEPQGAIARGDTDWINLPLSRFWEKPTT